MALPQEKLDEIDEEIVLPTCNKLSTKENDELFTIEKQNSHRIRIIVMYTVWVLIILIGIARVSHLIIPEWWRWLSNEDVSGLDNFLFSGVIGALLGRYANQILLLK